MLSSTGRGQAAWLVGLTAVGLLILSCLAPGVTGDPQRPVCVVADTPAFPKPAVNLSLIPPSEADFMEQNDGEKDRPFFDDFSWQDFIALNWPAAKDRRGVADSMKKFGAPAERVVWESWKSMGELFPVDPLKNPPTPWDSFAATLPIRRPGKGKAALMTLARLVGNNAGKTKFLGGLSKLEDINQAGFENLEFPLVAQTGTFVRYEIRVNKTSYNWILDGKFYLRKNLPGPEAPLEFLDQSITVKGAWVELPDDEKVRKRFYHTTALLLDWDSNGNPVPREQVVGLIGMHIVHKTPKRKNWIWATFEHVDNTDGLSPTLSSKPAVPWGTPGTNIPPPTIEIGKPIPKNPKPVEVARKTAIHPTTQKINDAYRTHPQIKSTIWANYQLVATQWPTPPGNGAATKRFPKTNVANVTMETYHQDTGCMNCHAGAQRSKFVFYLEFRAVDTSGANTAPNALTNLRKALKLHRDKKK
jgi:hypothetical protein